MINVSNDFKKRMQENRDFKSYAEITFPDGTSTTFDSSQFTATNNSLTDGTGTSSFPLGVAVQKNVQLEFLNNEQQYADVDFVGSKIRLYTDFQLDKVEPWASRNYWIISNNKNANVTYDENSGVYSATDGDARNPIQLKLQQWSDTSYLGNNIIIYTKGIGKYIISGIVVDNCTRFRFSNNGALHEFSVYQPNRLNAGDTFTFSFELIDDTVGACKFKNLKLELGLVENPEYSLAPEDIRTERIEKGTYTVVTPETYGETVIITAYDDMYKADRAYTTALTFPQTAGAVLRDACSTCDIVLGSTTFLHDDFMIEQKPSGTFREVIGYIAMIACGNARIDTRNRLQIMPYDLSGWDYQENVVANENLLPNSSKELKKLSNNADWGYTFPKVLCQQNTEYTFRVYIDNSENETVNLRAYLTIFFPDGSHKSFDNSDIRIAKGESGYSTITIVSPENSQSIRCDIRSNVSTSIGVYAFSIKEAKLEQGSVATIWTPAVKDGLIPYFLLNEFTSPQMEYNDTVITGFKTVIKGETSENDKNVLVGDDTYCINVENPLITEHELTVLTWLKDRICGVPFRPFSGDAISNPLIEFMDLAKVQDRRGNQYNTFITDINYLMNGYTTLKNSTPSMSRSAFSYTSDVSKVEQKARQLVEQERTNRELAVEKLSKSLAESSGLYTTDVRQPDGSTIRYLHDKPTIAESKIIIKITAEAIGISNDGGKTYPYGITLDGDTIMRIIQAEGILADWVKVGNKTITEYINSEVSSAKEDSAEALSNFANTVTTEFKSLQDQIDGAIETWFYSYVPTNSNEPAKNWKTTDDKNKHLGDLFYIVDNEEQGGLVYRWALISGAYQWQLVEDAEVAKALETASKAQDTADSKRRVFVKQPTPPYDMGDLWAQGASGDLMRCETARSTGSYVASDWKKATKYTDDTTANTAITRVSSLEVDMAGIRTEVSETKTTLNNLQIGGRNLVLDSSVEYTNSEYNINIYTLSETIELNEYYNITIWGELGEGKSEFRAYIGYGSGEYAQITKIREGVYRGTLLKTSWQSNVTTEALKKTLRIYTMPNSVTSESTITKIKLEHGNIGTDWSPAPEDVETQIEDRYSNLTQTIDGFQTEVGNIRESVSSNSDSLDRLEDRLQDVIDDASENNTLIEGKISRLEQTAENLRIEFSELTVDEVTTKTGYNFGAQGLIIDSSDKNNRNTVDADGMKVVRKSTDEVMLQANADGVIATDVTVNNYWILGHARFEKYGDDRVGCFYI